MRRVILGVLVCVWWTGCDCAGPVPDDDGGGGDGAIGTDDGGADDAGTSDASIDSGLDGGSGPVCDGVVCTPGQRCDVVAGAPTCVDNACVDLICSATERCEAHPAGGFVCVSIACSTDVECDPSDYCDGTVCVPDICTPAASRCEGAGVLTCDSNGGGETMVATCMSASYFPTACVDDGSGGGGCSCEDEWDCPAFHICEVGRCVGSGVAPTCTLPPVPFADVPPTPEIQWGGLSFADDDARDGTGTGTLAPWPSFSHVLNTPVVANLDDDNGDGLINELDFPEIIFVSHQGNNPWANAVLRAIHGGGPNRGADFFARCGDLLWRESAPISDSCSASAPDSDAGAPVAVGDLDSDGFPEIVAPTEGNRFRILAPDGQELYRLPADLSWSGGIGETIAIADLDFDGFAELIVGRTVYVMGRDASGSFEVVRRLIGGDADGSNDGNSLMSCPADVRPDLPGQELVAGGTLYRLPSPLAACGSPPCTDVALETVWDSGFDGFCAVADVWGADTSSPPGPTNVPDGVPEIVLIDNGRLRILASADGSTILDRNLGGGSRGGAPNIDDFDGDGFVEVASALQNFYVVVDLQASTGAAGSCPDWPATIARATASDGSHNPNPARSPGGACTTDSECDAAGVCNTTLGQCVCLHNGWQRDSDDDSSRMTSSSVFDFNGDGAAEVLYNDECDFRVYEGTTGEVLFTTMSRSRTGIENPVVADVDNDGNAEAISVSNTSTRNRCDEDSGDPRGPNGIRVWGDPNDTWVSARRIWNQQSYHVVNVTEGSGIPMRAPESWGAFNGRTYNTYRSQPRSFGVAPDLVVQAVDISSPDVGCGALSDTISITFQIRNAGDLRVGPGVRVVFFGSYGGTEEPLINGAGVLLEVVLTSSLEPGRSVFLSVSYDRSFGTRGVLPDSVRVVVDPVDSTSPFGAERECNEANNELTESVDGGVARADLRIELDAVIADCAALTVAVPTTVYNDGSLPASNIDVRYYAGDPAAGGTELHRETIAGPVAGGANIMITATITGFPQNRDILIYATVDPDDTIDECNNGNNTDAAPDSVICTTIF